MSASADLPLSLVICTYDRPDLVAQVLETVAQQDAPRDAYEVLVIDNASPRDIAGVVASFEGRVPGLRCIREEAVGLSHARNRGWHEARGEYVAYVDDDCKLPSEWVSIALGIASRIRPVMFGGPARAFYMTPKPRWFLDDYGSVEFAKAAGPLPGDVTLSGMNMVIRKDCLAMVGGFDPALGMTGMTMAYGEETALQQALREHVGGDCVYYDPALLVYHLVRPEKMSVWWIIRRRFLGGLYGFRCRTDDARPQAGRLGLFMKCVRIAVGFGLDVIRGALSRDRSRFPYVQNYIWEHASYRLERLGLTWGQLETCGR
ncbi:MAG: glycosyltransferase [Chthonomonadales bacterium]|nr:glycosyltransferase [Chthonomonadales bacterium]